MWKLNGSFCCHRSYSLKRLPERKPFGKWEFSEKFYSLVLLCAVTTFGLRFLKIFWTDKFSWFDFVHPTHFRRTRRNRVCCNFFRQLHCQLVLLSASCFSFEYSFCDISQLSSLTGHSALTFVAVTVQWKHDDDKDKTDYIMLLYVQCLSSYNKRNVYILLRFQSYWGSIDNNNIVPNNDSLAW